MRHIDPAATARTGQPHVRLHVPERALTTWIVLDVSPSMAFGTARRLKADVAEGVALVFGRLGVRRAGSVGLVAFGAADAARAPAARRQAGDGRAAAAARRGRRPRRPARPRRAGRRAAARRAAGAPARARRRDLRLPRPATAGSARSASLRVRHSVLAVEIVDPREAELPGGRAPRAGRPGDRRRGSRSTPRARRVRERFAELERERREALARELRRLRIDHVALVHRRGLAAGARAATCDELRRRHCGWPRSRSSRSRSLASRSPRAGAPAATRSASRRSSTLAARGRPRRARGAAGCRPRSRSRRSPRSRWRSPGRTSATARRSTRRR